MANVYNLINFMSNFARKSDDIDVYYSIMFHPSSPYEEQINIAFPIQIIANIIIDLNINNMCNKNHKKPCPKYINKAIIKIIDMS